MISLTDASKHPISWARFYYHSIHVSGNIKWHHLSLKCDPAHSGPSSSCGSSGKMQSQAGIPASTTSPFSLSLGLGLKSSFRDFPFPVQRHLLLPRPNVFASVSCRWSSAMVQLWDLAWHILAAWTLLLAKRKKEKRSAQSTTRNLSSQEGHVTPALQPAPKPELGFSMESKGCKGCLPSAVLHLAYFTSFIKAWHDDIHLKDL